ncbi:MAG: ABC transporter permease, partial [Microbacteriaceae bacterium]|nr:ABC transporter permease [Microbacteriaceae bacterium]
APRSSMPDVLHVIGDWLPLSHAIDALTAVADGTHDDAWVWTRIGFLGAWIVGAVIVGALTLRRRTA